MLHQAADEVHIAAQPVELGDDDRAALIDLASGLKRGGRGGTLACLDFDKPLDDAEARPGGERVDGGDLGIEAEADTRA